MIRYWSLIKEHFSLKKDVLILGKKKKLLEEWLIDDKERQRRYDEKVTINEQLTEEIEKLTKILSETQKELEEYRDKYALLLANVLNLEKDK
jgi:hypothetical protein